MVTLLVAASSVVAVGYLWANRGGWSTDGSWLFVLCQMVMLYGSIPLLDTSSQADRAHLVVMACCISLFVTGALLTRLVAVTGGHAAWTNRGSDLRLLPGAGAPGLVALVVACLAVVALYFRAIGYSAMAVSIGSLMGTGSTAGDMATLRLASYAGTRYFAPGYVNQFKNALLPCALAFLAVRGARDGNRRDKAWALVLAPFVVMAILGTGQRGPFVVACLSWLLFANATLTDETRVRANVAIGVAGGISLFASTLLLGRHATHISSGHDVMSVLEGIIARLTDSNQLSSVVGFRYVFGLPTQNGAEWWRSIVGLLPGQRGSTLSNEIFHVLYGGYRGTSPVSLWGSVWYNWGPVGIIVVPPLLGVIFETLRLRRVRHAVTLAGALSYSGIIAALGTWIAGGPVTPINSGLLAFAGFALIAERGFPRGHKRPTWPPPAPRCLQPSARASTDSGPIGPADVRRPR